MFRRERRQNPSAVLKGIGDSFVSSSRSKNTGDFELFAFLPFSRFFTVVSQASGQPRAHAPLLQQGRPCILASTRGFVLVWESSHRNSWPRDTGRAGARGGDVAASANFAFERHAGEAAASPPRARSARASGRSKHKMPASPTSRK